MKKEYIVLLVGTGSLTPSVITKNGHVETLDWDRAKRWKTANGAESFIRLEIEKGSDWAYLVLPCPPPAAVALGKLAAGKPKTISKAESKARAARMAKARKARWN